VKSWKCFLLRNTNRTLVTQRPDADVSVWSVVDNGVLKAEGEGFAPGAAWSLTDVFDHFYRGTDTVNLTCRAHA
jgi:hypothetical protein